MPVYRRIYDLGATPLTIYFRTEHPFISGGNLRIRFYRPSQLELVPTTFAELEKAASHGSVWYVEHGFDLPEEAGALIHECEPDVRSMPAWVRKVNFNHWVDRTPAWTLFRCSATER